MAGASIIVEDQAVREALARLQTLNAGGKALKWIGTEVAAQVRHRIDTGGPGPDGTAWHPLNAAYAANKKGAGILKGLAMRGGLQGSIAWAVDGDSVRIGGTIRPVRAAALVFHLGGKLIRAHAVTIPARPYLGLSADNRRDLEELLISQIERLLSA
jgi:phage virion morphogenesis protein